MLLHPHHHHSISTNVDIKNSLQMLFPYHKYLGPGNQITYEEPIDSDDRIALLHDLDYELATKESDIYKADSSAVNEFLNDFLKTGNWHSLFGVYGLSLKYIVEKIIGIQYGMSKHKGQELYSAIQKELSEAYKNREDTSVKWVEFQRIFHEKRKNPDIPQHLSPKVIIQEGEGSISSDSNNKNETDPIEDPIDDPLESSVNELFNWSEFPTNEKQILLVEVHWALLILLIIWLLTWILIRLIKLTMEVRENMVQDH